jgi:hypothetical protein
LCSSVMPGCDIALQRHEAICGITKT